MNTSKYDTDIRKQLKRFQRSPGYDAMKKEHLAARERLEKEHLAARERLEAQLRERNEAINRLKQKLVEAGVDADEVAKLAA